MSNYPLGAWEDSNAPWNDVLCPKCSEEVDLIDQVWKIYKCHDCGWESE